MALATRLARGGGLASYRPGMSLSTPSSGRVDCATILARGGGPGRISFQSSSYAVCSDGRCCMLCATGALVSMVTAALVSAACRFRCTSTGLAPRPVEKKVEGEAGEGGEAG